MQLVKRYCQQCNKELTTEQKRRRSQKFCSIECSGKWLSENISGKNHPNFKRLERICEICGKIFWVIPSRLRDGEGRFCSRECYFKWVNNKPSGKCHPLFKSMERTCESCGEAFWVQPSQIKKGGGRFCSHKCSGKWLSENISGKNHPKFKSVEHTCENCSKIHWLQPCQVKRGEGKFCSRKCYLEWHKNNHPWHIERVERTCDNCGKILRLRPSQLKRGEGKFCSNKCYSEWMSKNQVGEQHPLFIKRSERTCEICGKIFGAIPSVIKNGGGRFCSRECLGKWMSREFSGENSWLWQGGISDDDYCELYDDDLRARVRSFQGNKCILCGRSKKEGGKNLACHHVNFDKMMCCNDGYPIMAALCSSCHSRTNNRESDWREILEAIIAEKYDTKSFYTAEEWWNMLDHGDAKIADYTSYPGAAMDQLCKKVGRERPKQW